MRSSATSEGPAVDSSELGASQPHYFPLNELQSAGKRVELLRRAIEAWFAFGDIGTLRAWRCRAIAMRSATRMHPIVDGLRSQSLSCRPLGRRRPMRQATRQEVRSQVPWQSSFATREY